MIPNFMSWTFVFDFFFKWIHLLLRMKQKREIVFEIEDICIHQDTPPFVLLCPTLPFVLLASLCFLFHALEILSPSFHNMFPVCWFCLSRWNKFLKAEDMSYVISSRDEHNRSCSKTTCLGKTRERWRGLEKRFLFWRDDCFWFFSDSSCTLTSE